MAVQQSPVEEPGVESGCQTLADFWNSLQGVWIPWLVTGMTLCCPEFRCINNLAGLGEQLGNERIRRMWVMKEEVLPGFCERCRLPIRFNPAAMEYLNFIHPRRVWAGLKPDSGWNCIEHNSIIVFYRHVQRYQEIIDEWGLGGGRCIGQLEFEY